MFKYTEEFDFSLDLVKKCGEVIKSAFHSKKKIRYGVCFVCPITFTTFNFTARRAPPMTW